MTANNKQIKKVDIIPSAITPSTTYMVPHLLAPNEYFYIFDSDMEGLNVLKWISDNDHRENSFAIIEHPIEVKRNSGNFDVKLFGTKIHLSSFEARLISNSSFQTKEGISRVKFDSDINDEMVKLIVLPRDINNTIYTPIISTIYITENENIDSGLIIGVDKYLENKKPLKLHLYNIPDDISSYEVYINDMLITTLNSDQVNDVLTIPVNTNIDQLRVIVKPIRNAGTPYKRIQVRVTQLIRQIHPIDVNAICEDTGLKPGDTGHIKLDYIDPSIESYLIEVNGKVIGSSENKRVIDFTVPVIQNNMLLVKLIAESSVYGLTEELLVPVDVDNSSVVNTGKLDTLTGVIENSIFRFLIRGTPPSIKLFKVYVNGVYHHTQKTLNGQVQVTGDPGDVFNITIEPETDLGHGSINYTSIIKALPEIDSNATLDYNEIFKVTDNELHIKVNTEYDIDTYDVTLTGVYENHIVSTSNDITIPIDNINQGKLHFVIKPIAPNVRYKSLTGVIDVVGIDDGYFVQLPDQVVPNTDITVHMVTNKPDIVGYQYIINSNPAADLDLDNEGYGVIHIGADLSPNFRLTINPIVNGNNIYSNKVVNIAVEETPLINSGIKLSGRRYGYKNDTVVLFIYPGNTIIDRYDIIINGNKETIFTLPETLDVVITTDIGEVTSVTIQPFNKGTPYLPYTHTIETIENPLEGLTDYNIIIDSGLVFNIPDTVQRFDNINIDVIANNMDSRCNSIEYHFGKQISTKSNIGDYMSPKVTSEIGDVVRVIAIPKSSNGNVKFNYTLKDVKVTVPELIDSNITVNIDETVHRLQSYTVNITTNNNPDIKEVIITTSNSSRSFIWSNNDIELPIVRSPVGTIINVTITPISKTGIGYQPIHRTVKVLELIPVNADMQLDVPATVNRLEKLLVKWNIPSEEDIIGVDLIISNINNTEDETHHILLPIQTFTKEVMDYDINTITSFKITPFSSSGIQYKSIISETIILPLKKHTADIELVGKPDYNIASGEVLTFIFNNNLNMVEFDSIRCSIITYNSDDEDVIAELPYDVSNHQVTLYKPANTKGIIKFEPIGSVITNDPNDRKQYKPIIYSWNINENLTIDSNITFGEVIPDMVYVGYQLKVPINTNPEGCNHFNIYMNDRKIKSNIPMLGNNQLNFDIPSNIKNLTSVNLGIEPLDSSNRNIKYSTKIIPLPIVEINRSTSDTKIPIDGAENVRPNTLITIEGYKTNGYIRAKEFRGDLYGKPNNGGQELTFLGTYVIPVDATYNIDDVQPDIIVDPSIHTNLQRDWSYKLKYFFVLNTNDDIRTYERTTTFVTMPPNRTPTASNDVFNVTNNEPQILNVVANDTDPDGDLISPMWVSDALHGTTEIIGGGLIKYTAEANYVGTDTFSYTVTDQNTSTDTATVTLIVHNHNPGAVDDEITLDMNSTASVNPLDNDFTEGDNDLSILSFSQPAHGTVIQTYNSLVYTPDIGFTGIDTSTYIVSNETGDTDTGEISWIVRNTDNAPVANDWNVVMPKNTNITIDPTQNDTDIDNDTLTIQYYVAPSHGVATRNGNEISYQPNNNYVGQDEIVYTISDGNGNTAHAKIKYTITNT